MASPLSQTIEQISREKHIEPEIIVAAIEDAMVVAARKYYKTEEDLRSHFNPDTGHVDVFAVRTVVENVEDPRREMTVAEAQKFDPQAAVGSEILFSKPTDVLGRIAAQTAKQVILQKVREAERDTIFNEYNGRVGEMVNCIVKRTEGPDLIVDIGRTEARLPKREQSRLESYNLGERLRVVIKLVERAARGPQVVVSRADGMLVQRLFEMEVPEIYDGTVRIRAVAREAGERTKIAVESRDKEVDPVGACVGMKGMRVQSIIRELRGEKIDIIEYSEDPVVFATHALSPAKVSRITILEPLEKHMEVIVDDSQLSLAIGKKGQNVRLAAKLLGWKIDIKSEEEKRQEVESAMAALAPGAPVSVLSEYGLDAATVEKLVAAGVSTIDKLGAMTPEQLEEIQDVGPVVKIQAAVNAYYSQFEEEQETEAPEETQPEAEPVSPDLSASAEEVAEVQGADTEFLEAERVTEPASVEEESETMAEPVAEGAQTEIEPQLSQTEPGRAE